MKKQINEWLDNLVKTNQLYPHRDLIKAKYFELMEVWGPRNWKTDDINYIELTMLFSNMKQWILIGDVLTNDINIINKHFTKDKQIDYNARRSQEANHNLYVYMWKRFNRNVYADQKTTFYNIPVRLDEGKRMNYTTTPIGLYSILNWKKTMANGNCSSKDLKAIHHYYYAEGYSEKQKSNWTFGGITANLAQRIATTNNKPTTDKKSTYEDIKMWWYKLKD
jgi:hypothetical protein